MNKISAIIREPREAGLFIEFLLLMSEDLSTRLEFIHAMNPADYPLGTPGSTGLATAHVYASLEDRAEKEKKYLTEMIRETMKQRGCNVPFTVLSEVGGIGGFLDKNIKDPRHTILAVKSKGPNGLWSQDATNMDIIRHASCPVLLVPQKAKYHPFHQIEYATDYNKADVETLQKLIALMGPFSPQITMVHITNDKQFDERMKQSGFHEMVRKKTGYAKIETKSLMERDGDDLEELINSYASLIDATLIVVLKENRHFLDRIFKSSATKKIVEQASIPVLVYQEH